MVKNLPVASGIGGGASNAAAAIKLLLEYYQINYSYQTPEGDETYYWHSYSEYPIDKGKEIDVVYLKEEPTVSMIQGLTNSVVDQITLFAACFSFLIGFG